MGTTWKTQRSSSTPSTAMIAGAPAAYFANLPIKAMLEALRERDIPAEISRSAGTFVCNALAFHLAHAIANRWPSLRGGFMHIPYAPQQVTARPGMPSMSTSIVVEALRIAVRCALSTAPDRQLPAVRAD